MEDLEMVIRKFALQNALFYEGRAQKGAVLGKIMGERQDLRPRAKEVAAMVEEMLPAVNSMPLDDIRAELEGLDPELTHRQVRERDTELPDLEGVAGQVVMRFAPSPSGPLHIGHSRAAVLNDEYVRRYGGKLIIRLEDTNPENILPDAYDWIPEDLTWLGVEYHEVAVQSDRFDLYLEHALKVLELGAAYVCDCPVEEWRSAKENRRACPHRDLPPEVQLGGWEKMLDGTFAPGDASMVVKTDLEHPNPAVRDFVAYRIVDAPHPRTGDRYRVYPMYNFSVVVDDHEMGMTHVLRGKDHLNNTIRQKYVYDHLGWEQPGFTHYGWVSIAETVLKTTTIKEGIASGGFTGWDDVRLGTFRSLARRGYDPGALRRYWKEVGLKEVDIRFSWETLNAMNKELVDSGADRFFFVGDPLKMLVTGADELVCNAPLRPDDPGRGTRDYTLRSEGGGPIGLFVSSVDSDSFTPGKKLRLKDLCNVEVGAAGAGDDGGGGGGGPLARYIGDDLSILKQGAPIIHWAPGGATPGEVHMPDGSIIGGVFEPLLREALEGGEGRVVQLERFGFASVRAVDGRITGAFLHK